MKNNNNCNDSAMVVGNAKENTQRTAAHRGHTIVLLQWNEIITYSESSIYPKKRKMILMHRYEWGKTDKYWCYER